MEKENRAIMYRSDPAHLFTFRRWDGQQASYMEWEILGAPMSDDTKKIMENLIHLAQEKPYTWIDYASVIK